MSSVAKKILIKSVLQSISTYAMGVFKFPLGLVDDLEHIIYYFWWEDDWLSWDNLTRPKAHGDMGFRYLHVFNQDLLARLA
jgi:hypothetical protein